MCSVQVLAELTEYYPRFGLAEPVYPGLSSIMVWRTDKEKYFDNLP